MSAWPDVKRGLQPTEEPRARLLRQIRQRCQETGVGQGEFLRAVGLSRTTWRRTETGQRPLQAVTVQRAAEVLGVDPRRWLALWVVAELGEQQAKQVASHLVGGWR